MKKIMLVTLIVTLASTSAVQSSDLSMDPTNPFGWVCAADAVNKIVRLTDQTQLDAFKIFLQTQDKESINQPYKNPNCSIQETALTLACRYNENLPLVIALLEAGANPNIPSDYNTPLGAAAYYRCSDIVTTLLNAGADATFRQPLVAACQYTEIGNRSGDPEIVVKLLNAGALVNKVEIFGLTPLLAASGKGGKTATKIVDLFIKAGADVDQGNNNNITPLYAACEARNLGTVKLLLKAGANPNAITSRGKTPLFYAWNPEVAQLLIDAGVDINQKDINNETAFLQICRMYDTPGLATVFLEAGANPNEKFPLQYETGKNSTPLHLAAFHRNKAAVEEILAFARKNP